MNNRQDMHRIQRHGGKMDQVHMPVEPAVETEIAQLRRNPVPVGRVIAEHDRLHACGALGKP